MATNDGNDATEAQRAQRTSMEVVAGTDPLTERIFGCAIEVHRHLGPGLLESTYEEALCIEMAECGLQPTRRGPDPLQGREIGEYRLDLLVEDSVVVEVKSVERYDPIFQAQVLTYLRATGRHTGLLINFNSRLPRDGVKRFVQ